ncbi:glutamate racemase [Brevibacillus sp. TJ4]|uniref:glutamate racemase n=1 Tax=Brevibacillus sp. TJ4 TaxID=3234853 RepID=UPI0037D11E3A
MEKEKGIAVIDSGVGGLTVVKEIMRQLPSQPILYMGDNARCPYGSKTPEEIRAYSFQMIDFVTRTPLKALVIACNTATAVVLDEAKKDLPVPVIGVIEPGARAAVNATRNGRIGVIGTEATIRSQAYTRSLLQIKPDLHVTGLACPSFVPLVEKHLAHTEEARRVVSETLTPLLREELDTLILGCTHYPLLAPVIQEVVGDSVTLISSAEETARELAAYIGPDERKEKQAPPDHVFVTTGDTGMFREIAEEWLSRTVRVEYHALERSLKS